MRHPQGHLAILGAVSIGGAVRVMTALRPGQFSDLGLDEVVTSGPIVTDPASKPPPPCDANSSSCSLNPPGQPLRQRRISKIDQPDLGQRPQAERPQALDVQRLPVH